MYVLGKYIYIYIYILEVKTARNKPSFNHLIIEYQLDPYMVYLPMHGWLIFMGPISR